MTKISLIKQIEEFAKGRYPHYVNGAVFEDLARNMGKKASNAGRRCRELETGEVRNSDGTIRHIRKALFKNPDKNLKSVEYRWIPTLEYTTNLRPEYSRARKLEMAKII